MSVETRNLHDGEWFWMNRAVVRDPHLTSADLRVYAALASYAGCAEIHPSIAEITRRGCLGRRTVIRVLKHLESVGYIGVLRGGGRGRANQYELLKAINGCRLCTELKNAPKSTQNGAEDDREKVPTGLPKEHNEGNTEEDNPPRLDHCPQGRPLQAGNPEDRNEFINLISTQEEVPASRVDWWMQRIAAKALGDIRTLAYYRKAFPGFWKREQYELVDHLTQFGANLLRQDPWIGSADLREALKCEAARIGFADYADAVSMAIQNLHKGISSYQL